MSVYKYMDVEQIYDFVFRNSGFTTTPRRILFLEEQVFNA
jgi:hypothetical protein